MISCEWKTDKATCSIFIERKQAGFLARCRHYVLLQSDVRAVATAVVSSSGLFVGICSCRQVLSCVFSWLGTRLSMPAVQELADCDDGFNLSQLSTSSGTSLRQLIQAAHLSKAASKSESECHSICIIMTRQRDIQMIEVHLDQSQTAVIFLTIKDTAPKNVTLFSCLHSAKSDAEYGGQPANDLELLAMFFQRSEEAVHAASLQHGQLRRKLTRVDGCTEP
jgi:hypothetical protein